MKTNSGPQSVVVNVLSAGHQVCLFMRIEIQNLVQGLLEFSVFGESTLTPDHYL